MAEDEAKEQITADDWAAALAEQEKAAAGSGDDWAAALAEQAQAEAAKPAQMPVFDNAGATAPAAANNLDMILDIPVNLTVELGRTKIAIRNLLQLAQGSVVELDGLAGEPMDVLVNGCLIAQGEVVVVNDKFGIRLTDIITPAERIRKLQR
ncbi:MAG: flagellar motor switch protein FliN [Burkholderiales bacterium]